MRVQVVINSEQAALFRSVAARDGKSLSAWLRDLGLERAEKENAVSTLRGRGDLLDFFKHCDLYGQEGCEPEWDEHKRLILEGMSGGRRS